jgi:hypothetical protein
MGLGGAGDLRGPWLGPGPARAIDPGPDQSVLESADCRDGLASHLFDQLDPNQSCPPGGVLSFHLAGGLDQRLGHQRGRAATSGVVGIQRPGGIGAVVTPDAPNSAVRQTQLGRDLS